MKEIHLWPILINHLIILVRKHYLLRSHRLFSIKHNKYNKIINQEFLIGLSRVNRRKMILIEKDIIVYLNIKVNYLIYKTKYKRIVAVELL